MAAIAGEHLEDLIKHGAKVEVKETVSLVEDEIFEVFEREAFGVLEMVEQPAWDMSAHTLHAFGILGKPTRRSDDDVRPL